MWVLVRVWVRSISCIRDLGRWDKRIGVGIGSWHKSTAFANGQQARVASADENWKGRHVPNLKR